MRRPTSWRSPKTRLQNELGGSREEIGHEEGSRRAGHEAWVANARDLRLIIEDRRKSDQLDARQRARVARLDPSLLASIERRTEEVAGDPSVLRARNALVAARTRLGNHVRGAVKSGGARLKRCSTESLPNNAAPLPPEAPGRALPPVLTAFAGVIERIADLDSHGERLAEAKYPETALLGQVSSIAALTALAFVLTLERPERFRISRAVGAYPGLVAARDPSGRSDPQLRISKERDPYLRRVLVKAAQRPLRRQGRDCDLRRSA